MPGSPDRHEEVAVKHSLSFYAWLAYMFAGTIGLVALVLAVSWLVSSLGGVFRAL